MPPSGPAAEGPPPPVPPAQSVPRARKRLGLVLAGGGAAAVLLGILFWPRGGAGDAKPDVPGGPAGDKGTVTAPDALAGGRHEPPAPRELFNEDFSTALKKGEPLPDGWTNKAFGVVQDRQGKPSLVVNENAGEHYVTVRLRSPLSGNFSVQGEYLLHGGGGRRVNQSLTIRLESVPGRAPLRVGVDYLGAVTIDSHPPRPASKIHWEASNSFRLERRGKTVFVDVNDHRRVAFATYDEVTEYIGMQIGLSAGDAYDGRVARLYGLKVEILPP
jgi:hypothetical protein